MVFINSSEVYPHSINNEFYPLQCTMHGPSMWTTQLDFPKLDILHQQLLTSQDFALGLLYDEIIFSTRMFYGEFQALQLIVRAAFGVPSCEFLYKPTFDTIT